MGYIFEQLGIHGLEQEKEDAILASLLTGDPSLMIGKQGTAKTALAEAIGSAFRERSKRIRLTDPKYELFEYAIYDSSKINFEDLIGFPNPAEMQQGRMGFISSPMTAWGKKLIVLDEFNRQEPARQNNIFELLRSRRLMGRPTGTIWLFNCMNPFGMAGTEELDAALVDRHQWFLNISSFTELNADAQLKIVRHVGNSDGIALRHWSNSRGQFDVSDEVINETYANVGDTIDKLMTSAAKHYNTLLTDVGPAYAKFVAKFWNALTSEMNGKDWKVELSGRRAGMVHRALIAYRAIDIAMCEINSKRTVYKLKDMFKTVLSMSIPIGITTAGSSGVSGAALTSIQTTVDMFGQFFNEKDQDKAISAIDVIYELITTKNIRRKIELIIEQVTDEIAKNQVWSEIMKTKPNQDKYEATRNAITIGVVAHLMTVRPDIVPANIQAQVAKQAINAVELTKSDILIETKGQLAYYATDIEQYMKGINSPFGRLQAKAMLEEYSDKNTGKLPKSTFDDLLISITNECKSLDKMLKDKKLNVQQNVPVVV